MKIGANVIPTDLPYGNGATPATAFERIAILEAIATGNVLQLQKRDGPMVSGEIFLPVHEIVITRDSVFKFTVAGKHRKENLFQYTVSLEDGHTCTLSLNNGVHAFKRYLTE